MLKWVLAVFCLIYVDALELCHSLSPPWLNEPQGSIRQAITQLLELPAELRKRKGGREGETEWILLVEVSDSRAYRERA